jgi:hypothetical protein
MAKKETLVLWGESDLLECVLLPECVFLLHGDASGLLT